MAGDSPWGEGESPFLTEALEGESPGAAAKESVEVPFEVESPFLLHEPETPVKAAAGAVTHNVVLVAGYDYARSGVVFDIFCENRRRRYIRKDPSIEKDPAWKFTLFDVRSGEVRVNQVGPSGKRAWSVIKTFTAVTRANYSGSGKRFDTSPAGVMSITDVYEHVRSIGQSEPGSLVELGLFAHGWMGGPILVNSNDNSGSRTDRDPDDKDGRSDKDFIAPNMDAAALAELQAAFAKDGFSWVWGCVFTHSFHHLMHKVLKHAKYRGAGGAPDDAAVFSLAYTREQAEAYFDVDPAFYPARDAASGEHPLEFTRTFAEIKDRFRRGMAKTYPAALAKGAARTCFGALPGTYADYEVKAKLALMLIPTKAPPYADNFTSYLRFYKRHLAVTLDAEGRGYGQYPP